MDFLLVTSQLVLASILFVAGASKLADRAGSERGIVEFGLDSRLARPLAVLVPLVEVAVAVGLLLGPVVRFAGLAAALILLAFTLVIAVNVALGRRPDCHCFGSLHSSRAGVGTLIRNGLLLVLAGIVVSQTWGDGADQSAWNALAELSSLGVVGVVVAWPLLTMMVVRPGLPLELLTHAPRFRALRWLRATWLGAVLEKGFRNCMKLYWVFQARTHPPEGLPDGTPAPRFSIPTLDGGQLTLDSLLDGRRPLVIYFADPVCHLCHELLPEVAALQADHSSDLRVVVATRGTREENAGTMDAHGVADILLQKDNELLDAYQVYGTPAALILNEDGTIGSEVAHELDSIRLLFSRALSRSAAPVRAA